MYKLDGHGTGRGGAIQYFLQLTLGRPFARTGTPKIRELRRASLGLIGERRSAEGLHNGHEAALPRESEPFRHNHQSSTSIINYPRRQWPLVRPPGRAGSAVSGCNRQPKYTPPEASSDKSPPTIGSHWCPVGLSAFLASRKHSRQRIAASDTRFS
jgi:hypothetical protein